MTSSGSYAEALAHSPGVAAMLCDVCFLSYEHTQVVLYQSSHQAAALESILRVCCVWQGQLSSAVWSVGHSDCVRLLFFGN